MRFLIDRPTYIEDQYIEARVQEPKIIEMKADASLDNISRSWKPLDEEAVAAIAKLGKGRHPQIVKLEAAVQEKRDVQTMYEAQQGKRAKRGGDEAAIRVSPLPDAHSSGAIVVTSAK